MLVGYKDSEMRLVHINYPEVSIITLNNANQTINFSCGIALKKMRFSELDQNREYMVHFLGEENFLVISKLCERASNVS